MDWSEDEKPMDEITAKAFDEMCEAFFLKREMIDGQKDILKTMQGDLETLESRILAYLHEFKKRKHVCSLGTVTTVVRESWKIPQGEDRTTFFNFLKERGLFETLATVNSNTMNSFVKAEMEAEREKGNITYRIPGLAEPTTIEQIRIMKG